MNQQFDLMGANSGFFAFPERIWRNQLNLEGALGIEWRCAFSHNRRLVALSALYEGSYWPRMFRLIDSVAGNNTPPTTAHPRDEDVSLQGLTLEFSIFF